MRRDLANTLRSPPLAYSGAGYCGVAVAHEIDFSMAKAVTPARKCGTLACQGVRPATRPLHEGLLTIMTFAFNRESYTALSDAVAGSCSRTPLSARAPSSRLQFRKWKRQPMCKPTLSKSTEETSLPRRKRQVLSASEEERQTGAAAWATIICKSAKSCRCARYLRPFALAARRARPRKIRKTETAWAKTRATVRCLPMVDD